MDIEEHTAQEYREPKVRYNVHEPTAYELAEEELKAQERIENNKLNSYGN